jgi:trimeric autotransporter adhesin
VGFSALAPNVGSFNSAFGDGALGAYIGGGPTDDANTALGSLALNLETNGERNTAVGRRALNNLLTGSGNTAVGQAAGFNYAAGETGNVTIGATTVGVAGENNTIRIADTTSSFPATDCFIGGIFGNPTPGVLVYIDAAGHLSTTASSRRFKDDIEPMDKTSEAIFALKPVTFRYKQEIDPKGIPQVGLVAEEVEKVNPNLIARDGEGKVYTVRYDQVWNMMLNEFLKEHKKVEEQQATISELKNEVQTVVAQLKEQAAQIQKVSAQIEMVKPAPQVVVNKP